MELFKKKKKHIASENVVAATLHSFDRSVSIHETPMKSLSCKKSAGAKPKLVKKMIKCTDSENVVAATFHGSDQPISVHRTPVEYPLCTKSAGSIEFFLLILSVAHRTLFNACIQVMWNAVFYDPIADYACAWCKRNRWSGRSVLPVTVACFKQDILCKNPLDMTGERRLDHVCSLQLQNFSLSIFLSCSYLKIFSMIL